MRSFGLFTRVSGPDELAIFEVFGLFTMMKKADCVQNAGELNLRGSFLRWVSDFGRENYHGITHSAILSSQNSLHLPSFIRCRALQGLGTDLRVHVCKSNAPRNRSHRKAQLEFVWHFFHDRLDGDQSLLIMGPRNSSRGIATVRFASIGGEK
jgi:hypothetical protein